MSITALGVALGVYVLAMFAISIRARGEIHDTSDYLVAGRRLPFWLCWPTIFATWFGAGALLTTADEVHLRGVPAAALDPWGAGLCLLIAGLFFASRLWRMQLLTLADFYRRRFGQRAEVIASVVMIPGYTGWIAAQFTALASVLETFFGIPLTWGIALVAIIGTGYTLIGGMWSVTLTDAVQMVVLIIGLVLLSVTVFSSLGSGNVFEGALLVHNDIPAAHRVLFPRENSHETLAWLGLLAAGSLGNLPGQDLMQRVFSARSATVARSACLVAGGAYLLAGLMPVALGLAARHLGLPEGGPVVPALAQQFLSPWASIVFILALTSAVLSTIDSAILAPASVVSQNLLYRVPQTRFSPLQLNQIAVVAMAGVSLIAAYMGESAFSMLESAYEVGMVSLLVPLCMGLFTQRGSEGAAVASMLIGTGAWAVHVALGWSTFLGGTQIILPMGLSCTVLALVAYLAADFSQVSAVLGRNTQSVEPLTNSDSTQTPPP